MNDTVDKFKEALKARLRDVSWKDIVQPDICEGSSQTGWWVDGIYVDWDTLDREIDEFAASFKAKP
jgi:hypothetical protein